MSSLSTAARRNVLPFLLAIVGAQAIYWLIMPTSHPEASTTREAFVVLQAVIGLGGAAWIVRRRHAAGER